MPLFAQAQFGQLGGGFTTWNLNGANTDNDVAFAAPALAPIAGRIRQLWAYLAGDGVSVIGKCVGWTEGTFTPDAKTAALTIPSGTHATGGQTLNTAPTDGGSPVVGSGAAVRFGWWRTPAASAVWSVLGAGSFITKTDLSGDVALLSPGVACALPYNCGSIQAFGLIIGVPPHVDYHLAGMAMRKKRI